MANPYLFDYPDHTSGIFAPGFTTDMAHLENEATWPKWTPKLMELYGDAVGRNVMIANIILQEDTSGPLIMQWTYDFESNVVELAKAVSHSEKRDQVVELKERMKDARKTAGLKG